MSSKIIRVDRDVYRRLDEIRRALGDKATMSDAVQIVIANSTGHCP